MKFSPAQLAALSKIAELSAARGEEWIPSSEVARLLATTNALIDAGLVKHRVESGISQGGRFWCSFYAKPIRWSERMVALTEEGKKFLAK
jgi:hypothetical protein